VLVIDDEQTSNNEAPPAERPGVLRYRVLLVMVVAVTMSVIIGLVGGLVDDGRLGGRRCTTGPTAELAPFSQSAEAMKRSLSSVEPEDLYRG
jgi:hypothetical protein